MNLNDIKKYAVQIKELVGLKDVMMFYGVEFNRAGFAVCPFHAEKTASLSIKNNRFYKCFGCGASGDVVGFVSSFFSISKLEAIIKINSDFNLGLPIGDGYTAKERYEADKLFAELMRERREKIDELKKLNENVDKTEEIYTTLWKTVEKYRDCQTWDGMYTCALALKALPIAEAEYDSAILKLNEYIIRG